MPATIFERSWSEPAPPLPGGARNHLDAKLTNLASATIDLARAGISSCKTITLSVDADSCPPMILPSACTSVARLLLAGPFTTASVTGAAFESSPSGIVLVLNPGHSDVTVIPPCAQPDLQVTQLLASNNQAREGDKVTFTATIANVGQEQAAGASKTEFRLNGSNVLGLIDTPALAPGASTIVSVNWDTRAQKGTHTVTATADKTGLVAESNEANNTRSITVIVKGNKTGR
jgi:hypothetical protein